MQFKAFSVLKGNNLQASNNFMGKMSLISEAREKIVKAEEDLEEKYRNISKEAIAILKMFTSKPYFDKNLFNEAAELFVEATKIKHEKAEPYFYLAWLLLYAGYIQDALKYLKIASALNPGLDGLNELRKQITLNAGNEKETEILHQAPEGVVPAKPQSNTITQLAPVAMKRLNAYQSYR